MELPWMPSATLTLRAQLNPLTFRYPARPLHSIRSAEVTANAVQRWNPGGLIVRNGFVIKLNPEGSAPLYSGFVGYYENVISQAIAVDDESDCLRYGTGRSKYYADGSDMPPKTPTAPVSDNTECSSDDICRGSYGRLRCEDQLDGCRDPIL